jgi:hypothetical protein
MEEALDIRRLADLEDIRALSRRYMRSLDRLEPTLLASVFHDDARVDCGFYRGDARQFVDFAMRALRDHSANHHMLGQMDLELERDVAFGEIYFQAFRRVATEVRRR